MEVSRVSERCMEREHQEKMSISWDSSLVKRMEPRLRVMPEMLWRRVRVRVSEVEVEEREAEASSLSRSFACKGGEAVSCW